MTSRWDHLAGGVRINRDAPRPDPLPPGASDWRDLPAGGPRRLSDPQAQNLSNACAAHSPTFADESMTLAAKGARVELCRRWLWYHGRAARNAQRRNEGMFLSDVARVLASRGHVPEDADPWGDGTPYDRAPSAAAYARSGQYLVRHEALAGGRQIVEALTGADGKGGDAGGRPVWFAFPVARSYFDETGRDGIVRPLRADPYLLPWHSECFVLWDPDVIVGDYGRGGVLSVGSWTQHGIAHPIHGAQHPFGCKWFPAAWLDDWDLVQSPYAPLHPLAVEV